MYVPKNRQKQLQSMYRTLEASSYIILSYWH